MQPPPNADFDPRDALRTLVEHEVDFVLVGGLAGNAWGSAYGTSDTDVVYDRSDANLERLAAALREMNARLRGAPDDLSFLLDAETLRAGLNFTFVTRYGDVDTLGEASGAPPYPVLKSASTLIEVAGVAVHVASLDHLIAMKDAAGRTKDKLHASEYRVISDVLRAPKEP